MENEKTADLKYQTQSPESLFSPFIKCFWSLENTGDVDRQVTVLPDGYFDILFNSIGGGPFKASLIGLSTAPAIYTVAAHSKTFSTSFKLLAAEYLLNININSLLNKHEQLPEKFGGLIYSGTFNIQNFAATISSIMISSLTNKVEPRKQMLFDRIHESNGAITVAELSDLTSWNSRQINRYFRKNFGVTLKTYCNILRFRASFDHLHNGQLFPSHGYFDQPHFIREVHKFSGTSPKHLAKNKEDRFIQLSTLDSK